MDLDTKNNKTHIHKITTYPKHCLRIKQVKYAGGLGDGKHALVRGVTNTYSTLILRYLRNMGEVLYLNKIRHINKLQSLLTNL